MPLVLVSLIDTNRQWFKSSAWYCHVPGGGTTPPRETPRDISFCGHTILKDEIMIIPDTLQDLRFADNPLVADEEGLRMRFYAGYPLKIHNFDDPAKGVTYRAGTLCLIDQRPRDLDDSQRTMLREFAAMVERELVNTEHIVRLRAECETKAVPQQTQGQGRSLPAIVF